jgi:hypothetical protein
MKGNGMDKNDELYQVGLALHGHKCPAMPLGLRAGVAAMEALGVQHAPDGQLTALVEIDRNHCSTCFADGVQVATGCTFGKGNIRSLGYGKFALTLIDNQRGRSVRVGCHARSHASQPGIGIHPVSQGRHPRFAGVLGPGRAFDRPGVEREDGSVIQDRAGQGDKTATDGSSCF